MKTRLKKLSPRECLLLERAVRQREAAHERFSALARAADEALESVIPRDPAMKGRIEMEEDGEDVWLVLEDGKPSGSEPAADAPVDPGVGRDGKPGMRAVAPKAGGE